MKFALLVALREYAEHVRTRGFWIGLFLFPAILFLSVQVPVLLAKKASPIRHYAVADLSGSLAPVIESRFERSYQSKVLGELRAYAQKNTLPSGAAPVPSPPPLDEFLNQGGRETFLAALQPHLRPGTPAFDPPRRDFQLVPLPAGLSSSSNLAALRDGLRPYLRGDKLIEHDGQSVPLAAALLIPVDLDSHIRRPGQAATNGASLEFWSSNVTDNKLRDEIEQAINTEIRRREYLHRGLDAAAIRAVEQTRVSFAALDPKKESGQEAVSRADVARQWLPSAFVYLLWVSLFGIVQMLLTSIIEEKSNRIIEVLLSSVTPAELMMGKLLGTAAIGLTMVGSWMLALVAILAWQSGGAGTIAGDLLGTLQSSSLIPMFGVYFILGYLVYAASILALGSVCNTLKEAQSYIGVITTIMVVPLLTMTFIPKDPNGPVARLLSWIPIYTPYTMMNRILADPPWIDLVGTTLLLLVSSALALWMAGKVFRVGILRTGQPPKLLELLRWLRRGQ